MFFWIRAGVALLILTWLIQKIEVRELYVAASSANWAWITVAFLLIGPNLAVQTAKWHYLLRLANPNVSLGTSFHSLIVGYPLGFVTPGRLGEIGRAFFVKEISQMKTFRLFVLDKGSNLAVVLVAGISGLLFLMEPEMNAALRITLLVMLAVSVIVLLSTILLKPIVKLIGRLIKIHHFRRSQSGVILAFALLFYSVYVVQFALLVMAFEDAPPFSLGPAAASVFFVKTLIPISFGDLGIREGAAVFFLGRIGIREAVAFNSALLLFVVNVGLPTLAGLPVLVQGRRLAKA